MLRSWELLIDKIESLLTMDAALPNSGTQSERSGAERLSRIDSTGTVPRIDSTGTVPRIDSTGTVPQIDSTGTPPGNTKC